MQTNKCSGKLQNQNMLNHPSSLFSRLAVTRLATRGPRPQLHTRGDLLKGFKEKQIKTAQSLQHVFVLCIQERIDHAVLPCALTGSGAISRQHMIAVPSPQWRHWSPTGQQGRCIFACNNGGHSANPHSEKHQAHI